MKEIKTSTIYKCDICGEVCIPIKEQKILVNQYQDFNSYIKFEPYYYLPYGTTNGDICFNCYVKYMKKHIEDICKVELL